MSTVKELIERAERAAGGTKQLAERLGVYSQTISNWKAGDRRCQPEDRALIAAIAGVDPMDEAARAMIEQASPRRAAMLREVLGKVSRATGAVHVSAFAAVAASASLLTPWLDTMYRLVKSGRLKREVQAITPL